MRSYHRESLQSSIIPLRSLTMQKQEREHWRGTRIRAMVERARTSEDSSIVFFLVLLPFLNACLVNHSPRSGTVVVAYHHLIISYISKEVAVAFLARIDVASIRSTAAAFVVQPPNFHISNTAFDRRPMLQWPRQPCPVIPLVRQPWPNCERSIKPPVSFRCFQPSIPGSFYCNPRSVKFICRVSLSLTQLIFG